MAFRTLTLSNPYSRPVPGGKFTEEVTQAHSDVSGWLWNPCLLFHCSCVFTPQPNHKQPRPDGSQWPHWSHPPRVHPLRVHRDFRRGHSRSQCSWHENLETASSLMPGVWLNELFNTMRDIIRSVKQCSESMFIDMENCSWYTNNKIIIIAIIFIIICINKVHRNQCGRISTKILIVAVYGCLG